MKHALKDISMGGRMAYVILCVEAYLNQLHPERDWTPLCEVLWKATETNWGDWPELYAAYIPGVLFSYDSYGADLVDCFSEDEYHKLRRLYDGLTDGSEDDELNRLLTKPHEMAMVYEGTGIGDGEESLAIIEETQAILSARGVPLPDAEVMRFSDIGQMRGWGEPFDGRFLSRMLPCK